MRKTKEPSSRHGQAGSARSSVMLALILIAGLLYGAMRIFVLDWYVAPSNSMAPGISTGDWLLARKWGYGNYGAFGRTWVRGQRSAPLARGDLVVFDFPKDETVLYVKRLIGLPGDVVSYKDRRLSINGVPAGWQSLGEEFLPDAMRVILVYEESIEGVRYKVALDPAGSPAPHMDAAMKEHCRSDAQGIECRIPALSYFVLGDNRDNSFDSRFWGFVPERNIVGVITR
jgi:signal peptidase I